jgi:hypothetical protein
MVYRSPLLATLILPCSNGSVFPLGDALAKVTVHRQWELGFCEQFLTGQERIAPLRPPSAEECRQGQFAGRARLRASAAADLAGSDQVPQRALGGVVGRRDGGVAHELEERGQVVKDALAENPLGRGRGELGLAQCGRLVFGLALVLAPHAGGGGTAGNGDRPVEEVGETRGPGTKRRICGVAQA